MGDHLINSQTTIERKNKGAGRNSPRLCWLRPPGGNDKCNVELEEGVGELGDGGGCDDGGGGGARWSEGITLFAPVHLLLFVCASVYLCVFISRSWLCRGSFGCLRCVCGFVFLDND